MTLGQSSHLGQGTVCLWVVCPATKTPLMESQLKCKFSEPNLPRGMGEGK